VKRLKGLSTFTSVFLVISVSTVALAWVFTDLAFQPVEEAQRAEIKVGDAEYQLENVKSFIGTEITLAGSRAIDQTASQAGREKTESGYWYCKGNSQAPTKEKISNVGGKVTTEFLSRSISRIRGVHNGYIYNIGSILARIGEPQSIDKNTMTVDVSSNVSNIEITEEDGSITIKREDQEISGTVNMNRFWYGQKVLKKWVRENNFQEDLEDELEKVDTRGSQPLRNVCVDSKNANPCQGVDPKGFSCGGVLERAERAVREHLEDEIRELESSSDYFDESGFNCSFETKNNYPGIKTEPVELELHSVKTGGCGESNETCECVSAGSKYQDKCIAKSPPTTEDKCDSRDGSWECDPNWDNPDNNEEVCEDWGGDYNEETIQTGSPPNCGQYDGDAEQCLQVNEDYNQKACSYNDGTGECKVADSFEPETEKQTRCEGEDRPPESECETVTGCSQSCSCKNLPSSDCSSKSKSSCKSSTQCKFKPGKKKPTDACGEGKIQECSTTYAKDKYTCRSEWKHNISIKNDLKVTCTDSKFNSIFEEDSLDNLEWEINLSYSGENTGRGGGAVDCSQVESTRGNQTLTRCIIS
jgi:hypothetical protein